jgi:CheY-like chemotaxis protein
MRCAPCFIPGPAFWQVVSAKNFAFFPASLHADGVIQPLALVFYEKLMPGSQLVNKLQDLNYRVQTVSDPALLQPGALRESPLLVLVDLAGGDKIVTAIAGLKADAATSHIPVIAFAAEGATQAMAAARKAGAKFVVSENAIANHLPELLEQALQIE